MWRQGRTWWKILGVQNQISKFSKITKNTIVSNKFPILLKKSLFYISNNDFVFKMTYYLLKITLFASK